MTTRDELIAIIQEYDIGQEYEAELADRILALLPPREPTEAMVEAMATAVKRLIWGRGYKEAYAVFREDLAEIEKIAKQTARAAWAAGYAKGEER